MNAANSPPVSGQNAVEALTRQHNWIFSGYMLLLSIGLIVTYLVWKTGNRVQQAIQADADARISRAQADSAQAKQLTTKLQNENIALGVKLALLQKDASNAVAAQQKVELELAKQRERTAVAEKDLAQLRQAVQPRRLSPEQESTLVKMLSGEPRGPVQIVTMLGDSEATTFANELDKVLKASGWTVTDDGPSQAVFTEPGPIGFGILVRNAITAPPYAARLQRAFFLIGIPLGGAEDPKLPEGAVEIVVGHKPNLL